MTGLYLLHFDLPYRHAKHYLGWAEDIERRVSEHQEGKAGVRLTNAAHAAGVKFTLVRTWEGLGRDEERAYKACKTGRRSRPRGRNSRGSRGRLCPLCHKKETA